MVMTDTKWRLGRLALMALACMAGCSEAPEPPPNPPRPPDTQAVKAVGDYLRDTTPTDARPPVSPPPAAPPAARPAQPSAASSGQQTAAIGGITWDVPEGWTATPVRSAMRKAQYTLTAETAGEAGELVVFYFGPGEGGTVDANIDRWINQFRDAAGNPPAGDRVRRESFESNGFRVSVVETEGRYDPGSMGPGPRGPQDGYKLVGAVVETPQGPWFFKATGPAATIDTHRDRVFALLRSVRPAQ